MATGVDAKLLKSTKFPPIFNQKVDMQKVNLQVMKKWIAGRISDILGNDDDVVIELCYNLIESARNPDIKSLQIQLTGFLESQTPEFCKELWTLLLSAQTNPQGIPRELLEAKKLRPKKLPKKHAVIQTSLAILAANALFGSGSQGAAVSPRGAVAMTVVVEVDPREPVMALVPQTGREGVGQNAHAHHQVGAGIFEAEGSAVVDSVPISTISTSPTTDVVMAAVGVATTDAGVPRRGLPRILVHGHAHLRGGPAHRDLNLDPVHVPGYARGRHPADKSEHVLQSVELAEMAAALGVDRCLPVAPALLLQNAAGTRPREAVHMTEDSARHVLCRQVAHPGTHEVTKVKVQAVGDEADGAGAEAPA
ncbi:hypothetical protein SEPCBS57363_002148 [Sporothrix epigloea]|uniref:PWI domain-containing protein n=1 Tax=Sporothrix epigloea TaxID=1892477 RepID=A0ABP0DE88_9PEZI